MEMDLDTRSTPVSIGARVDGSDATCGEVTQVVIDPVARAITHLVVESKHPGGPARLVPLELLESSETDEVRLRCNRARFDALDVAEETHFLPSGDALAGSDAYAGYPEDRTLLWPYYGVGGGLGTGMGPGLVDGLLPYLATDDILPVGEVAIHRGDRVHAVDGEIGRVQGVVIADPGHHVTHVLLQEGHLLGRKEVAIPMGAVTGVEAGVSLNISKHQVQDLPSVDLKRPTF